MSRSVPRLGYQPSLDGLRGIAILAVVLYHAYLKPSGGFFGVDLFFVLSGFLITTLLLEEHDETGRIALAQFYWRRMRRLWPALAVFLLVAVVAVTISAALGGPLSHHVAETYAAAAFGAAYLLNIVIASNHLTSGDPLVHLWSLGEEEQFYLLWPAALILMLRFSSRRLVLAALVLLGLVVQLHLQAVSSYANNWRVYFAPDTHCLPLFGGCLLALLPRRPRVSSPLAFASAGVFAAICLEASIGPPALTRFDGVVTVAAAAMILGCLSGGVFARLFSSRPLVKLGQISYSLYLWHVVVLAFLPHLPLVAIALSVAIAYASQRWIEARFRVHRKSAPGEAARTSEAGLPRPHVDSVASALGAN